MIEISNHSRDINLEGLSFKFSVSNLSCFYYHICEEFLEQKKVAFAFSVLLSTLSDMHYLVEWQKKWLLLSV